MTAEPSRKLCPKCDHANRPTAKVCSRCGYGFVSVREDGALRKFCTHCGAENRIRARVCVQCGQLFRGVRPIIKVRGQKWCPQCGKPRRQQAKVCSNCGYRFKIIPQEAPIVPQTKPAITLPQQFDAPPALPPDRPPKRPVPLEGEPAPYLTNDEINQIRGAGVYNQNLAARVLYTFIRKNRS